MPIPCSPLLLSVFASIPAAGSAAPGPALDFVKLAWISADQFVVQVTEMPDFDQSRTSGGGAFGLPGNGNAHCVPTSAVDLMAYAANHGFPELAPGPADWQAPEQYTPSGLAILQMGQFMDTVPAGMTDAGTTPLDGMDGYQSWLAGQAELVVTGYFAGGNYAPRIEDMAQIVLNGGLVAFCYGRYDEVGEVFGLPLIERDGGHCVALTRAAVSGESMGLWARDPASPGDGEWTTQSAFANRSMTVEEQYVATSFSISGIRLMNAIDYSPFKAQNTYLDGVYALRPKSGSSFVNTPDGPPEIWIDFGFLFDGYGGPDALTFPWALTPELIDVVLGPDGNQLMIASEAVGEDLTTIHSLALADGSVKPILAVPGVERLEFGRDRSLYAFAPGELHRIDLSGEVPTSYSAPLSFPADSLVFDDASDEVHLLSASARRLVTLPYHLDALPVVQGLPTAIPSGIEPVLALDPTDGRFWMVHGPSSTLYAWDTKSGAVEVVASPEIDGPTSIDVDDHGRLFVVAKGELHELEPVEGGYAPVAESRWSGLESGQRFRITRSRTNIDPSVQSGPAWRNLVPDEVASLADGPSVVDCANEPVVATYGQPKPGPSGVPTLLSADGPALLGAELAVRIEPAPPGETALLLVGTESVELPFDGGTLLVLPQLLLEFGVDASGVGALEASLGNAPALCGAELFLQSIHREAGAGGLFDTVQTNGLRLVIGS